MAENENVEFALCFQCQKLGNFVLQSDGMWECPNCHSHREIATKRKITATAEVEELADSSEDKKQIMKDRKQTMKWDYFTAHCYYHEKDKQYTDHWALNIYDKQHHRLEEGLKILGNQGWELVAVQQIWKGTAEYNLLSSWYVFKRQLSD